MDDLGNNTVESVEPTEVIDIYRKAMKVRFTVSKWGASKKDEAVTQAVAQQYGASVDAGRWTKKLIAKEHLEPLNRVCSAARKYHNEMTLPWGDNHERILKSSNFQEYSTRMRDFQRQFEIEVGKLRTDLPVHIQARKQALGTMWKQEDYPTLTEFDELFNFETIINPIEKAEDFRVEMAEDEVANIQGQIEARIIKKQTAAIQAAYVRAFEHISLMAQRLAEYGDDAGVDEDGKPKRKKFFKDSVIENVMELAEILPKLNVFEDADLEQLAIDIKKDLCRYTPRQLRKFPEVREKVADRAKEIEERTKSLAGLYGQSNTGTPAKKAA